MHYHIFIKSNIIAFVLPDLCIRCPQKEICVLLGAECRLIRFFFFFFLFLFNVPVNNFSVMLRRSHLFLGITSTFGG